LKNLFDKENDNDQTRVGNPPEWSWSTCKG
jgi:hypothetical protein